MIKKLFLAIIIISGIFLFSLSVKAMLTPQVNFTDIKLEKETFKPGEEIKGSVSLWNYEQFLEPDLFLFFGLMTDKDKDTNIYTTTIDWKKNSNGFMLLAGEKVQKDFNYVLPQNLPSGKMEFKVWVANSKGEVFSFTSKEINIDGNDNFLTLINKSSNKISFPISIPSESDPIKISYSVRNNLGSVINVFPKITLWKKNMGGEVIKEEKKDLIALKPKEEKSLALDIIEPAEPYFSLVEMRLYDDKDQPVSNSIYITPLRSFSGNRAEIFNASCDKGAYQAGETANVKIQFSGVSGSSDQSAEKTKIAVKMFDNKSKEVVGSKEEEVNSGGGEAVISFPVNKAVSDFKVESSIIYNAKVLADYSFNVVFGRPAPQSQGLGINSIYLIILIAIFVLIVMILFIYLIRKRRTFLLFLIFASITFLYFSSNNASAVTQVISDCHNTIFSWGAPAAGQTYMAGDTVNFTGSVTMNLGFAHGFQNVIYRNIRFRFYVAKNMDIKYAECCARDTRYPTIYTNTNACGSTLPPSNYYPNSCASFRPYACRANCVAGFYMDATKFTMDNYLLSLYCGQYKVVGNGGSTAEDSANYRKIGEVTYLTGESGEYSMPYNVSYQIPLDIGFTGPFRFYVDFEAFGLDMDEATSGRCLISPGGSLCGDNWFWGIYYQPEANILPLSLPTVNLIANPTTVNSGGSTTLSWTTSNATSCTASGDWSGVKSITFGSEIILNITGSSPKTYTLTCINIAGGSASSSATVNVISTHLACQTVSGLSYCQSVAGAGADTCSTDGSCRPATPTASISGTCNITAGNTFILTGTANDADGSADIASSVWKQNGTTVKSCGAGVTSCSYTSLALSAGNYTMTFTVTDLEGHVSSVASQTCVVSVAPAAPTVTINSVIVDPCKSVVEPTPGEGKVTMKWTFHGSTSSGEQDMYQIHLTSDGVDKTCEGEFSSHIPDGSSGSAMIAMKIDPGSEDCSIPYGKTYSWTLKARQAGDNTWTAAVSGTNFTVSAQLYPYAKFTPPAGVKTNYNQTFIDLSQCYSSVVNDMVPCVGLPGVIYDWNFSEGDADKCVDDERYCSTLDTAGNVIHIYSNIGSFPASLQAILKVTQNGVSCPPASENIVVNRGFTPPIWFED